MNASEFSRELAGKLGKDENQVRIFDRALAESGVRKKTGRGRHADDITRQEAVMLLLAILSGRPATKAARAAVDLSKFDIAIGLSEDALEAFHHAFGVENDLNSLTSKSLADLVALLCGRLTTEKLGQDNFVFLCVKDGATAEFQFQMNWMPGDRSQRLGLEQEVPFTGLTNISRTSGNYYESRTATGELLRWIGQVTEPN